MDFSQWLGAILDYRKMKKIFRRGWATRLSQEMLEIGPAFVVDKFSRSVARAFVEGLVDPMAGQIQGSISSCCWTKRTAPSITARLSLGLHAEER
jgi:hypothetical protein